MTDLQQRNQLLADLAVTWTTILAGRLHQQGYSDESALVEANRLALLQAADLVSRRTTEATQPEPLPESPLSPTPDSPQGNS